MALDQKRLPPRPFLLSIAATAIVFALLSIAAVRLPSLMPRGLYTYDEADYECAAGRGIAANWQDRGVLSIASFVAAGMKSGLRKSEWSALSQYIRSSSDIAFYRHYHGPLYFYWLRAASMLGFSSEGRQRYASLALLAACAASLLAFAAALFPGRTPSAAIPVGAAFLFGPSAILALNHVTPHALYLFFSIVCLGYASLFFKTGRRGYWYLSITAAAFAFMTLEYALFLLATILACLYVYRKEPGARVDRSLLGLSCLCFFLPMLLLWPAGLLKLTVVKNYLFFTYFVIFRGSSYSALSPLHVWFMRLRESPFEYLLLIAALASIPVIVKKHRFLLPAALYGALILLTTLRNTSTFPQYIISAFPAFYLLLFAGFHALFAKMTKFRCSVVSAVLTLAALLNGYLYFSHTVHNSLQPMPVQVTSLIDLKKSLPADTMPVFINRDYVPVLHYYFPGSRFVSYSFDRDSLGAVISALSRAMANGNGEAFIILDAPDTAVTAAFAAAFAARSAATVYISERVRHAACYRLALKNRGTIQIPADQS